MNQFEVNEILMNYSSRVKNVKNKDELKDMVRELKDELDLRKVVFMNPDLDELEENH